MRKYFSLLLTMVFFVSAVSLFAADKKDESKISVKKYAMKTSAHYISRDSKDAYFSEGFEGDFPPAGWTLDPGTGDDWQQDDGSTHGPGSAAEGSYCIYFNDYNYSTGTSASIITPAIDLSGATSPLLSFYYWDGGGSDYVDVSISTDGTTFTSIFQTATTVDPWTVQNVDLSDYVGQSVYVKFTGTSVYGYSNPHIDDVVVDEAPSDPILSLNYTGISFGMQEVGSSSTSGEVFIVSNTGGGTLTFTSVSGFDGTPFSTDFDSSVELGPGAADTFAVNFDPTEAGDFSASLIFESNGGTDTLTATGSAYDPTGMYVESFEDGVPPTDWEANTLNGSYNWEQYEFSSSIDGNYVARYNSYSASSGSSAELITPNLDLTQNDNDWVGFYYAHPSSYSSDWLDVYMTTDTNWVKVDSILVQDSYWHFYQFNVADYISDTNSTSFRVKFVANSKYGVSQYLDKVILPPVYVSTSTVDWCNLQWPPTLDVTQGDSVTVYSQVYVSGVTEGEGQGAGIECWIGLSTENTDPATWDESTWASATYNEFGPTGSNDEYMAAGKVDNAPGVYYYTFRYRYDGGPYTYGGYSASGGGFWDGTTNVSGVLTVNPLVVTQFPYFEGFENGDVPPIGWVDTTGYWSRGTESHSGDYCARVSYSHSGPAILESPEFVLPDTLMRISFWWKDDDISTKGITVAGHDTTFFEVSTNGVDWITLDTLSHASHDSEYSYVEEDITSYANGSFWFRFRDITDESYSAWGTGIDDITIEPYQLGPGVASNPVPENGATDVPLDQVVTWDNPSATTYNVIYGMYGDPTPVINMDSSAIRLDGAIDTTVYSSVYPPENGFPGLTTIYWRVVEYSADGNYTVGPVWSFTTAEDMHPAPFNLMANNGIGAIPMHWSFIPPTEPGSFSEGFEGGVLPTDWQTVDADSDGYDWTVVTGFAHSGDFSIASFSFLNGVGALTPDNWLISPSIALGDTPELTFWIGAADSNWYQEHFELRVSTTGQDPADFTDMLVDAVLDTNAAGKFALYTIDLSAYANQTINLAWVHNNVSDQYVIVLDDIKVTGIAGGKDLVFNFNDKGQIKLFKSVNVPTVSLKHAKGESSDAFKTRVEKFASTHKPNLNLPKSLSNFNIYRNGSLVGTADTTMYVDMNLPAFDQTYSYYVTAMYDDGVESVPSNTVEAYVLDPAEVIFFNDFEMGELPPYYTVVDANNDGYTWQAYEGYAESGNYSMAIRWNSSEAMNDWVFIGPINMHPSSQDYHLDFGYRVASSSYPENLAVYLTDSIDVAGKSIVQTLFDSTGITNTEYAHFDAYFQPSAEGQYYIAFKGFSDPDMWRIALDDILLTGDGNLITPVDSSIVFQDDFENGTGQWQLLGGWGLTQSESFSPTHSFTESPNGNYPDNAILIANMINPMDFSQAKDATLEFMTKYQIEEGFDYLYIDIHYDGISGWRTVAQFTGIVNDWTPITVPLGGFVGKTGVKLRLRFVSDAGYNMDGAYIDDFVVRVSNEDTSPPLVFSPSPVMLQGTIGDYPIEADITDISGVAMAKVGWATGPDVTPNFADPDSVIGSHYYFHIPAQEPGTMIGYGFVVADSVGNIDTVDNAGDPYMYIAGNYLFYDDAEVTYVTAFTNGQGAAMRMTIPENNKTTLVTSLIRNYTDSGRPNGDMLVHVWDDNNGQPGNDLITPFVMTPAATIAHPYRPTVVDLRDYDTELSNMQGDFWIGFTVPSTDTVWITLGRQLDDTRSFVFDGNSTWSMSDREFQFRAITGVWEPVGVNDESGIPQKFELKQNYPNPFNPTTKIKYALPKDAFVTLKVYNSLGQEVATLVNQNVSAGYHTIDFNASNLASGMYIYRIKAGNFVSIKKMMLLK